MNSEIFSKVSDIIFSTYRKIKSELYQRGSDFTFLLALQYKLIN